MLITGNEQLLLCVIGESEHICVHVNAQHNFTIPLDYCYHDHNDFELFPDEVIFTC